MTLSNFENSGNKYKLLLEEGGDKSNIMKPKSVKGC